MLFTNLRPRALPVAATCAAVAICLSGAAPALADSRGVSGQPTVTPQPISASEFDPATTTVDGGASVVSSTRTVAHWWASTTNPQNGVTYGYNMVGANPNTCSSSECSVTVQADITPLIVHIDGMTFDGTTVVGPTLSSPIFATNDYGSTPYATAAGNLPNFPRLIRGPGGALSQGDAGQLLQLEDATMRAQFNQVGATSPYHLTLRPNVLPAVTIDVPANHGTLRQSPQGVIFPAVDASWWSGQINNLEQQADATHLALYLSNDVLLRVSSKGGCCFLAAHGTHASAGLAKGYGGTSGNAVVQTMVWASWITPGTVPRTTVDPSTPQQTDWAVQDIDPLSAAIAGWADDPYSNNTAEPWATPNDPQFSCIGVIETADPVLGSGFAIGTNTFEQDAPPADGYYHPSDEAFLPWFMRLSPNTVSEPTQSASTNTGRYTLLGDLNPFVGFGAPATSC